MSEPNLSSSIGPVADLLRGDSKQSEYGKVLLIPHAPDAWSDPEKTKVGYEIPFNRYFYAFKPPFVLAEIDADLKGVTGRVLSMFGGLSQ